MRNCLVKIVAVLLALAPAMQLLAQETKPGAPPAGNPLLNYFIALILFAIVAAGALNGSKRSHQD